MTLSVCCTGHSNMESPWRCLCAKKFLWIPFISKSNVLILSKNFVHHEDGNEEYDGDESEDDDEEEEEEEEGADDTTPTASPRRKPEPVEPQSPSVTSPDEEKFLNINFRWDLDFFLCVCVITESYYTCTLKISSLNKLHTSYNKCSCLQLSPLTMVACTHNIIWIIFSRSVNVILEWLIHKINQNALTVHCWTKGASNTFKQNQTYASE